MTALKLERMVFAGVVLQAPLARTAAMHEMEKSLLFYMVFKSLQVFNCELNIKQNLDKIATMPAEC